MGEYIMSVNRVISLVLVASLVVLTLLISPFAKSKGTEVESYQSLIPYYHAAARTGDKEIIVKFVTAGFPINAKNSKGYTALMVATYNGRKDVVNELLNLGANVCAQDNRGNTALMAAIFRGELMLAKQLLSYDCDTNQQNGAGQTAQEFAEVFGRVELEALLESKK